MEIQQEIAPDNSKNSLDRFLKLCVSRKKILLGVPVVTFITSIIVTLLLPNVYCSTSKLIPAASDQGIASAFFDQMGALSNLSGLVGAGTTRSDLFASMLGMDAIKEKIVDRFHLMDEYGADTRVEAYAMLDDQILIDVGKKDGIVSISVFHKDPKKAADMANSFVGELGKLAALVNNRGAGYSRTFYEARLVKAKTDLAEAEDALKAFLLKNKMVDVREQAQASIVGVAQLRAQLALAEVEMNKQRTMLKDTAPEIKAMKATIQSLRDQIALLEGNNNGGAIPTVGMVPTLGEQQMRLLRDVKTQETIVEMLTKQYELSKLQSANEDPPFEVLQVAKPADKKAKPKRAKIVLASTLLSIFLTAGWVVAADKIASMSDERREQWQVFWKNFLKFSDKG